MNRLNNLTRVIPKSFFFANNKIIYPLSSTYFGQASVNKGINRFYSSGHEDESFDAFTERYIKFFDGVDDRFELQRGLNNCFAYDLIPSPTVIEASLKAARRVNDYSIAVRVFEGLKQKVENDGQYNDYLEELAPIKEELGILTKEEMGL
nr:2166_t:CDS:2 [Entrophospora candida]CAG8504232.1 7771_t:CDS:2 [Entrophospora candida]